MKKVFVFGLLAIAMMMVTARVSVAQEKRLNSVSPEFRTFYSKFIVAVHRGDKTAVATMTSFPLTYGFDAGDEGKYTKSVFLRNGFARMFGKAPARFLPEKNPVISGGSTSFTVSTKDATHLVFTKGGKRFFFTNYLVEP